MSPSEEALGNAPPAAFVAAIAQAEIRRRRRLLTVAVSLVLVPVLAAAAFYATGKKDADRIAASDTKVSSLQQDVAPIKAALGEWGDDVKGFPGRVKALETSVQPVAATVAKLDSQVKAIGETAEKVKELEKSVQPVAATVARLDSQVKTIDETVAKVKELERSVQPVAATVAKLDSHLKTIDETVAQVKTLVGDESVEGRVSKAVASQSESVNAGFNALNVKWTGAAKASDLQQVRAELQAVAADRGGAGAAKIVVDEAVKPLQTSIGELATRLDKARELRQGLGDELHKLQSAVQTQGQTIEQMGKRLDDLPRDSSPSDAHRVRTVGTVSYVDPHKGSCTVALEPSANVPSDALLPVRRPSAGGALVGYIRLAPYPDGPRPPRPPDRVVVRTANGFADSLLHVREGDVVQLDAGE